MKRVQTSNSLTTSISEKQDEMNKRLIARGSLVSALISSVTNTRRPRSAEQVRLIEMATPDERQAYLSRQVKTSWAIMLCFGLAVSWLEMQPRKPAQPKPLPVVEVTDAGSVKGIQLHETSLSTATTVTTTAGVYQVRGGVSASAGDEASLEAKDVGTLGVQTSLCIKSKIKTACYPLK